MCVAACHDCGNTEPSVIITRSIIIQVHVKVTFTGKSGIAKHDF